MWRFALGRLLRYFSPPLLRDTLYVVLAIPICRAVLRVISRFFSYQIRSNSAEMTGRFHLVFQPIRKSNLSPSKITRRATPLGLMPQP